MKKTSSVTRAKKDDFSPTRQMVSCSILHQINLEIIISIEDKLWTLLECLRRENLYSLQTLCKDWWEAISANELALGDTDTMFKDDKLKKNVRQG